MKSLLTIVLFTVLVFSVEGANNRRSFLLTKKSSTGLSTNAAIVDTFIDFHLETIGTQLSPTAHKSSYGETNWIYTSLTGYPTNAALLSNVVGTNVSFPYPIAVGNTIFTSTGTNWLRESFLVTNDYLALSLTYSESIFNEAIAYYRFSKITNSTIISKDSLRFLNNPYVVPQYGIPFGENAVPHFGIHTGGGGTGPSSVFDVPVETVLRLEIVQDCTNNLAYVRITDASSGSFIGSSVTYSNSSNSHQNIMELIAGYIALPGCFGYFDRTAVSLNHTSVNTNRPPWLPNAPSLVTVTQTGSGEVTLSVVDNNNFMNYYHIDIWNSGTWTNNITNIVVGSTNVIITGLSGGSNYNFRAYATGPLVTDVPSAKVESGTITLSSAAWYDSISYASTDSTQLQDQTYKNLAVPVIISSSGNATKIRVGVNGALGSIGFKVALYDSLKNLLVQATSSIDIGDNGTLKEFTISSTAVTPGTYYIGWTANNNLITYNSKSGTTGTEIHCENTGFDYAAYAPSNLSAVDGCGTGETVSAGVLVQ